MTDTMTPAERGAAIAQGKPADRLPCNPNVANGVARVYGCKISEFNHDAKTLAAAQVASYRRFGYDSIRIFTDLFPWAEAMGAKVKFPEDDTADLEAPAINDVSEIDKLRPADPYKDGRLPVHLEAMKYLRDAVEGEIGCSCGIPGAFTNAFFLMGVDKTLNMLRKNPEPVTPPLQNFDGDDQGLRGRGDGHRPDADDFGAYVVMHRRQPEALPRVLAALS